MAGRPRKPTNLKIMQGNPGNRPLPENEPAPEVAITIPEPPEHLSEIARVEWRRVAIHLHNCGILTTIDLTALEAYCDIYGRYRDANAIIAVEGMIVSNSKGFPVVSPWLAIVNKCLDQMRRYLTEFGMTPASRSKVQSVKPKEEKGNRWDKFRTDARKGGA